MGEKRSKPQTVEPRSPTRPMGAWVPTLLEFLVKTAAIGVPILYTFGRIYATSYWEALHLPAALMEYEAEDFLYMGFSSIFSMVTRIFGVHMYSSFGFSLLAAIAIALTTVVLVLVNYLFDKMFAAWASKFRGPIERLKATTHGKFVGRALALGVGLGSVVLLVAALGLFLLALTIVPLYLVVKEGQRNAAADLRQITLPVAFKDKEPASLATITLDGKRVRAPLFQCAPHWCVVLLDGRLSALPEDEVGRVDAGGGPSPLHSPQPSEGKRSSQMGSDASGLPNAH